MIEIRFRPMLDEPDWKNLGSRCQIRPTFDRAMSTLRAELARIGATDVVLEAGFTREQLRQDGLPFAHQRPRHSTVRVTFKRRGEHPMSMTCGGHEIWFYNVYLIAMTLEALRAVDRYGCTQGAEQYAGWSALPGGEADRDEFLNVDDAASYLASKAGWPTKDGAEQARANPSVTFRVAALRHHPDHGGSAEIMRKIVAARDYVVKHQTQPQEDAR